MSAAGLPAGVSCPECGQRFAYDTTCTDPVGCAYSRREDHIALDHADIGYLHGMELS